jgi:hypothetical protein
MRAVPVIINTCGIIWLTSGVVLIKTNNLLLIICFAVLIIVSSCSVTNASNYPLSVDDGGSGSVGNNLNKAGDAWVFGILFIRNNGKTPIKIIHVALTDEENMITKDVLLREVGERGGLIGCARWPIELSDCPIALDPDDCREAEGAVIEPGGGYNLILIVESQADDATASGLTIAYEDGNHKKYVQKSNYAYFLSNEALESN